MSDVCQEEKMRKNEKKGLTGKGQSCIMQYVLEMSHKNVPAECSAVW